MSAHPLRIAFVALLIVVLSGLVPTSGDALTLKLVSTKKPWPSVTVRHYTIAKPLNRLWVVSVDLCGSNVHIDATRAPDITETAGDWGGDRGAQIATNGDFYKTGPVRVYGQAVGDGVPWPLIQTGVHPDYASEWYAGDFGWIAFGHDAVEFSHTGLVKKLSASNGVSQGWSPKKYTPTLPPGVLGLVSGFPELVTEGKKVACASPTASTCFPDRSDMRARHPRTAMGLSQDRKTFFLVVVDGRTSKSLGMYGTELADVVAQVGAWQAFNLDGGGSSELWQAGTGYLNDVSGNNNGSGTRPVANHWGIIAKAVTGFPARPGHCIDSKPCGVIPAAGGTVDNSGACFRTFGAQASWHTEKVGNGGSLRWTNAYSSSQPDNWAWWRLQFAEAGTYKLEYKANAAWGFWTKVKHTIRAGGKNVDVVVNQKAGSDWTVIGTYTFAAGGDQWVAIFDHASGTVAKNQHIVADAVRLTRVDPFCGDGTCNSLDTCANCPKDCGACPVCGDGTCSGDEACGTCAQDCGACVSVCGDGECAGGEACATCTADCGECPAVCGDGECTGGEDCASCGADCGPCPSVCGDGDCDQSEGCATCPADCGMCGSVCGDGTCQLDEGCGTCSADCGACAEVCGNGNCALGEDCGNCPIDCGACPEVDVADGCGGDGCDDVVADVEPGATDGENPDGAALADDDAAGSDTGVADEATDAALLDVDAEDAWSLELAGADSSPADTATSNAWTGASQGGCQAGTSGRGPTSPGWPWLLVVAAAAVGVRRRKLL
jgi:MYXO-CTERM domain-containing protein